MKESKIFMIILVIIMAFSVIASAQNQNQGRNGNPQDHHFPFMQLKDQLTDDQIQELKDLVKEMREDGFTKEEIHDAIIVKLESWGIEIPEDMLEPKPLLPKVIWDQLTDDQKETIKETITTMKEDGATGKEIRDAVNSLLEEWGIDHTKLHNNRWRRVIHHRLMEQLTEEQQAKIKALVEEMDENGATRQEIHEAVIELLKSWEIEIPKNWGERRQGGPLHEIMDQLTDEQKAELRELIQTMHEEEATREEIHDAITELLLSWGIEVPEDWGDDPKKEEQPEFKFNKQNVFGVSNHPNPFNPDTHISYSLQNAAKVDVKIYDMTGNLIRTLTNTSQEAGSYTLYWNGTNENGSQMPSGMYLVKIIAGSETITHNMILMK